MPAAALSARSVIASTLLGTHPPIMDGRLLVAFARRFGIAEGTARVALSRMVERGELTNEDGRYRLAGHLVDRQRRQDAARTSPDVPWDGSWVQAVVVEASTAQRRSERRSALASLKLAELREGVWLRPDNLGTTRAPSTDLVWATVVPDTDPGDLVAALWDLDDWADEARRLCLGLADSAAAFAADDDEMLTPGFVLAAAVLRHLLADPALPAELAPPDWPAAGLRGVYDDFEAAYQALLRRFFRSQR